MFNHPIPTLLVAAAAAAAPANNRAGEVICPERSARGRGGLLPWAHGPASAFPPECQATAGKQAAAAAGQRVRTECVRVRACFRTPPSPPLSAFPDAAKNDQGGGGGGGSGVEIGAKTVDRGLHAL